jgi:hypothetical protein
MLDPNKHWLKKDLKLLLLAIERGQDDIADLTDYEYDVLESVIKSIKKMILSC